MLYIAVVSIGSKQFMKSSTCVPVSASPPLQEKLDNISQNDDGCHRRNEVLELHNEVLR